MKICIYGDAALALGVQRARMTGLGGTERRLEPPSPALA